MITCVLFWLSAKYFKVVNGLLLLGGVLIDTLYCVTVQMIIHHMFGG